MKLNVLLPVQSGIVLSSPVKAFCQSVFHSNDQQTQVAVKGSVEKRKLHRRDTQLARGVEIERDVTASTLGFVLMSESREQS